MTRKTTIQSIEMLENDHLVIKNMFRCLLFQEKLRDILCRDSILKQEIVPRITEFESYGTKTQQCIESDLF